MAPAGDRQRARARAQAPYRPALLGGGVGACPGSGRAQPPAVMTVVRAIGSRPLCGASTAYRALRRVRRSPSAAGAYSASTAPFLPPQPLSAPALHCFSCCCCCPAPAGAVTRTTVSDCHAVHRARTDETITPPLALRECAGGGGGEGARRSCVATGNRGNVRPGPAQHGLPQAWSWSWPHRRPPCGAAPRTDAARRREVGLRWCAGSCACRGGTAASCQRTLYTDAPQAGSCVQHVEHETLSISTTI
jgi:hypothetical protein